jgi:hypothetical protein
MPHVRVRTTFMHGLMLGLHYFANSFGIWLVLRVAPARIDAQASSCVWLTRLQQANNSRVHA